MTPSEALLIYADVVERWPHSQVVRDRLVADLADVEFDHARIAVETFYRDGREFAPNGAQIRGRVADLALDAPDWGTVKGEIDRRRAAVGGADWKLGDRTCPDGLCDGSGIVIDDEDDDPHADEREAITTEFLARHEPVADPPKVGDVIRFVAQHFEGQEALAALGAQHLGLDRPRVFEFVSAHAALPAAPVRPRSEITSRYCTCREQMLLNLSAATGIHPLVNEFIYVVGRAEIAALDGDRIAESQVRKKWEDHVLQARRGTVYHGLATGGLPALERLQRETAVRAGLLPPSARRPGLHRPDVAGALSEGDGA